MVLLHKTSTHPNGSCHNSTSSNWSVMCRSPHWMNVISILSWVKHENNNVKSVWWEWIVPWLMLLCLFTCVFICCVCFEFIKEFHHDHPMLISMIGFLLLQYCCLSSVFCDPDYSLFCFSHQPLKSSLFNDVCVFNSSQMALAPSFPILFPVNSLWYITISINHQ